MPDQVTVTDSGSKFLPHPEGQFPATCVDIVDLGERRMDPYKDKPARLVHKAALVFQTGKRNPETDELFEVHAEFTVSFGDKASLRAFLESWRGKSYTPEQAKQGVPLHKLAGQPALISVEHKLSASNNRYAKIKSIAPLPSGLLPPTLPEYERPKFWTEKKEACAEQAAKFRAEQAPMADDDYPPPVEPDDDLPF